MLEMGRQSRIGIPGRQPLPGSLYAADVGLEEGHLGVWAEDHSPTRDRAFRECSGAPAFFFWTRDHKRLVRACGEARRLAEPAMFLG